MADPARQPTIEEHPAHRYAVDVRDGTVPAGRWLRLACTRYLDAMGLDDRVLLPEMAQHAIDFIQSLRQSKGKKWSGMPLLLERWQQFVTWNLFGWYAEGDDGELRRLVRSGYIEVPRKNGKALEADTPVATPAGWKPHGDLRPGDLVFSPSGVPVPVLAATGVYDGPASRVEFSDGSFVVAHDNHEWRTERSWFTGRRNGSRAHLPLVTTERMRTTLTTTGARHELTHRVAVAGPLVTAACRLPVEPYALGAWLGDGTSAGAQLTCFDGDIVERIARAGTTVEEQPGVRGRFLLGRGWFQAALRELGVLGDKHFPAAYLRAPLGARRALLEGMIDTDGHVTARGQVEIVQAKRRMADGVVALVRGLGYKPTMTTDRAMIGEKDCGPRHRVQFWPRRGQLRLMARKSTRLTNDPGRRTRSSTRHVRSVDPVGTRAVNCVQVLGGMYLAGDALVPTHNSTFAAAVGLYLLVGDEEPGAEVYSAATTRDQAKIVWTEANRMASKSQFLRERVQQYKASIFVPGTESSFVPLASREDKLDGLNVHGALVDELHAHPTREVWDKLETGMGSRDQPMILGTTTAGLDTATFCYEQRRYAENVLQGVLEDPTFFAYVACPDEGDDWQSEETWKKSNPNWGVSVLPEDMRRLARKAAAMPAARNAFRRLRLNLWTSASGAWMDMDRWSACGGAVDADELEGLPCWGGLDLASTMDLTALVLVFPDDDGGMLRVVPRFWMPKGNVAKRSREDRVPYDEWARQGLLVATPGDVTDYDVVRADVAEAAARHDIQDLAFDPYNATQIAAKMLADELPLVEHRQGFLSMNAPMKELERLIHSRRIAHGGHPILRWMAANTVASRDASENIKPDKAKSREKIDGIVALIMAVSRWMLTGAADAGSIYDTEGIEVL